MTSVYRHIACCIDGRRETRAALKEARRIHREGSGLLSIVHVVELDLPPLTLAAPALITPPIADPTPAARGLLDGIVEPEHRERAVLLRGDNPARTVCEWAADVGLPDLLIVGSYRSPLARTLRGSFAGYLSYHAPCSVLVVRSQG